MNAGGVLERLRGALRGSYDVEREVGAGGMATVFLARARGGGDPVAVKVLRPELAASLGSQRFLREIEFLSVLDHPHILPLLDAGQAADLVYYVMPFAAGATLRDRLARQRQLPLDEALGLAGAIGNALSHAHGHGILHRDVKPENVLLAGDRPLLTDFGIARVLDAAGGDRLTQTGFAMGTPAYMSPEQAMGERSIDARSDLYGLACVLFEMLAGEPPFTGDSPATVLARRLSQDPPPVRALRGAVPARVESALGRALSRSPADRHASVADFLSHLAGADTPDAGTSTAAQAVVVLDFRNLSVDPEIDWVCGGVAESLIADLRRAGATVVSRERARRAQTQAGPADPPDHFALARALNARWVVAGGVQRAGDALRVTCRFYDSAAGEASSGGKVDGALGDLFELQDRVAGEALAALGLAAEGVGATSPPQATRALEAYELYAKGRQMVKHFGPARFGEARQMFEHAIGLDPSYAPAYSGLGYLGVFSFIASTRPEELEEGMAQLERAIELDAGLVEAHNWLTYGYMRQRRFDAAERSGRRAVALEPDNSMSHYFLGCTLAMGALEGRGWTGVPAGMGHLLESVRLDPTSQPGYMLVAWLYGLNGQPREARAMVERAVEIERSGRTRQTRFLGARTQRALFALRDGGDAEAARRELEEELSGLAASDHLYAPFFAALARCGLAECARRRHDCDVVVEQAREAQLLAESHPERLGMGYLLVRARLLRAVALHELGMRREAKADHAAATALFEDRSGFDFSLAWEVGDGLAHYDFAALLATAGQTAEALAALDAAFARGWGDLGRLDADPAFERLRRHEELARLRERARARGELPPPVGLP